MLWTWKFGQTSTGSGNFANERETPWPRFGYIYLARNFPKPLPVSRRSTCYNAVEGSYPPKSNNKVRKLDWHSIDVRQPLIGVQPSNNVRTSNGGQPWPGNRFKYNISHQDGFHLIFEIYIFHFRYPTSLNIKDCHYNDNKLKTDSMAHVSPQPYRPQLQCSCPLSWPYVSIIEDGDLHTLWCICRLAWFRSPRERNATMHSLLAGDQCIIHHFTHHDYKDDIRGNTRHHNVQGQWNLI